MGEAIGRRPGDPVVLEDEIQHPIVARLEQAVHLGKKLLILAFAL